MPCRRIGIKIRTEETAWQPIGAVKQQEQVMRWGMLGGTPARVRVLLVTLGEQALSVCHLHVYSSQDLALREAVQAHARQLKQNCLQRSKPYNHCAL